MYIVSYIGQLVEGWAPDRMIEGSNSSVNFAKFCGSHPSTDFIEREKTYSMNKNVRFEALPDMALFCSKTKIKWQWFSVLTFQKAFTCK